MTTAVTGARVGLTWTQFADANKHRSPQKLRLQTRPLKAGAPIRTLATLATKVGHRFWDWRASFVSASAIGPRGCTAHVWRADPARGQYGGLLTSRVGGRRATYPDKTVARGDLQAALACTRRGHAFLARTAGEELVTSEDGQTVVGGDAVVTRLR